MNLLRSMTTLLIPFAAACGVTAEKKSPRGWVFEMQLRQGLSLTDSNLTDGEKLYRQLSNVSLSKAFFRDPVTFGGINSASSMRVRVFGVHREKSYAWKPLQNAGPEGIWGACRADGFQAPCEQVHLVNCMKHKAEESLLNGLSGTGLSSDPSRSLLLEWSTRCGLRGAFYEDTLSELSFRINGGGIVFSPRALLSLLIFKGIWSDYEEAAVQSQAKASLPAVVPCNRSDGACLASPAALSSCVGCESLESGQIYTVFFIESLRQDYSSVRSMLYVHEQE
ncbi:MAG: hypothetical protein EBR09_04635 [Proteobacteria bacterium]|nr:hypothetical protein [Pseudomonadota bacterium]